MATGEKLPVANLFRNQRGLPPFIPRDLIERLKFNVMCASGEPTRHTLKVSDGLLLTAVPPYFAPPLEYGDHIVKMNGIEVTDKIHFVAIIREAATTKHAHTLRFEIERVIPYKKISLVPNPLPKDYEMSNLCEYLDGSLVFFPKAAIGLGLKSYNRKVFVESTDNGFTSIGRRLFFIGDSIVAINGVQCTSVKDTGQMLLNELRTKCIVHIIVERAVEQPAVQFVRAALNINTNQAVQRLNPKMQDDVIAICLEEVKRLKREKPEPTETVLKEDQKRSSARVEISSTSTQSGIGMEQPRNPNMLLKAPGMFHAKQSPSPGRSPKSSKGALSPKR